MIWRPDAANACAVVGHPSQTALGAGDEVVDRLAGRAPVAEDSSDIVVMSLISASR
jgi:hypothetical protein